MPVRTETCSGSLGMLGLGLRLGFGDGLEVERRELRGGSMRRRRLRRRRSAAASSGVAKERWRMVVVSGG